MSSFCLAPATKVSAVRMMHAMISAHRLDILVLLVRFVLLLAGHEIALDEPHWVVGLACIAENNLAFGRLADVAHFMPVIAQPKALFFHLGDHGHEMSNI